MRSVATRVSLSLVVCLVALLTLPALPLEGRQALPQQGQPQKNQSQATFRVRVEYVEVDAVVRDKQGNFVGDLKKEDFEVLEDGKRQEIVGLELVDVPVEPRPTIAMLAGRPIEQDVYSNEATPGRVYLIVLDDLHIHPARTPAARRIARKFIEENLAPNDLAAVVSTSGNRRMSQDFTTNKRLLLAAVDKVVGRKVIAPGLASLSAFGGPDEGSADAADPQRMFNARTSLETLAALASYAGSIHNRRKTLILVGEGPDYDLGRSELVPRPDSGEAPGDTKPPRGFPASRRELRDKLRDFIDTANRANVTLYAIDPAVYTQGGDDLVDVASGIPGDYDSKTGEEVLKSSKVLNDLMGAQENLRTLANGTGGFAVTGSPSFAKAFERITNDNSHYYILGYYPTNEKRDGKFRKIEVKLKRAGLNVSARRGYIAPKGDRPDTTAVETREGTSTPLREALLSALPTTGFPMTATAAAFRGAAGNASVLLMLQTAPGVVQFEQKAGRYEGHLEVSFVAVNDQGKTQGGEHLDLVMPLKPETYNVVSRSGMLVQSRVALPPGRYVLRVGARDSVSQRVGTVHCDLEVPAFDKLPVAMSGLIVSSGATVLANPRPDPEMSRMTSVLPGSPVVDRTFRQGDTLGLLTEIYDTKLDAPHDIDITAIVLDKDGREAYRHDEKRSTSELQGMKGGFGYALKVPLAGVPPGTYLLRVEAKSRLDVNSPVTRETMFRIVAAK